MKPEFHKLINLFEELEVAGENVSLTILSREGKSTIKLQLESPPSPSSTATPTIPAASAPVPGRRRRHRGAAARARRRQRAADHQGTTLAAPASAPAPHQQYHPPLRHPPHLLLSPSPSSGRRRVMSVGRLPMPSFGSLNLDGPPPSPPSSPLPPPPPPPPPPSRPLTRTALRVRNVELRDFGGSDEGLANLAESFKQTIYRRRWLSLSRSIFSSSSSASSPSSSGSVSDHPDCSDLESVSEGCWETDSDVG